MVLHQVPIPLADPTRSLANPTALAARAQDTRRSGEFDAELRKKHTLTEPDRKSPGAEPESTPVAADIPATPEARPSDSIEPRVIPESESTAGGENPESSAAAGVPDDANQGVTADAGEVFHEAQQLITVAEVQPETIHALNRLILQGNYRDSRAARPPELGRQPDPAALSGRPPHRADGAVSSGRLERVSTATPPANSEPASSLGSDSQPDGNVSGKNPPAGSKQRGSPIAESTDSRQATAPVDHDLRSLANSGGVGAAVIVSIQVPGGRTERQAPSDPLSPLNPGRAGVVTRGPAGPSASGTVGLMRAAPAAPGPGESQATFERQLVRGLIAAVRRNGPERSAVVRLNPESLGQVKIQVSLGGGDAAEGSRSGSGEPGTLSARFEVSRPETLQLMRDSMPVLESALSERGLRSHEIEISLIPRSAVNTRETETNPNGMPNAETVRADLAEAEPGSVGDGGTGEREPDSSGTDAWVGFAARGSAGQPDDLEGADAEAIALNVGGRGVATGYHRIESSAGGARLVIDAVA